MASFSDNFARTNTVPGDLGTNWTVLASGTLQIVSHKVAGQGVGLFTFGQLETANQVGNVLIRPTDDDPTIRKAGVILRGATDAGYICGIEIQSTTYVYVIWKRYNGVLYEVARSLTPQVISIGYDLRVRAIVEGTGIRVVNPDTGGTIVSWVDDGVTAGPVLAGPGYNGLDLGVDGGGDYLRLDNWFVEDTLGPEPPFRPTIQFDNIVSDGFCIQGSMFYDRNYDSHNATQYQIALCTAPDFSAPVVDLTVLTGDTPNDEGLTYYCFSGLLAGTCYKARIRYEDSDGMWSEWSPIQEVTTTPEVLPIEQAIHWRKTYEKSCVDAPERVYRFTLLVQEQIQRVYVTEIETPEGIYTYGDIIPKCVIDYIKQEMDAIIATWP